MDLPLVGEAVARIPITAECCVPRVSLLQETLDFGSCFLRHEYTLPLVLSNESKLPGKFEVVPQDEQSKGLAVYTAEPSSGPIPGRGNVELLFTLSTERTGPINLPVRVRVVGSNSPPLELIVAAISKGPTLVFGKESGKPLPDWKPDLNFGNSPVLTNLTRQLYVTNSALIPAELKTFVTGKDSSFWVDVREAVLQPEEEICITVSVFVDALQRFKDTLNILVMEGRDVGVPLETVGIGSTVVPTDWSLQECAFGTQLTSRPFEQELVLMNMGRDMSTVVWFNPKEQEKRAKIQKFKSGGKTAEANRVAAEEVVFSIEPEKQSIKPKESATFVIRGMGKKAAEVDEHLQCKVTSGKDNAVIFDAHCTTSLVQPYVELSTKSISYVYSYDKEVPVTNQNAPLTIKNVTALPLGLTLKTALPWIVDGPAELVLEVDQEITVNVVFNAGFKPDKTSATVQNKLSIAYADTPYKDTVELLGEVNFPNLELSTSAIQFGSVLNDTTKRVSMSVTNTSKVDCVYNWVFAEDAEQGAAVAATGKKAAKEATQADGKIRASQVFDILPVCGMLKPGESEVIEFSFYAHANQKLATTAVCEVEGGPAYNVEVACEASTIKYAIDKPTLHFGQALFHKTIEKDVQLQNTGRVPFPFKVSTEHLQRKSVLDIRPTEGRLGPGEKVTFKMKITPGIPDRIVEKFQIQVAHFEPEEVSIVGEGIYPTVQLNVPHVFDFDGEYEGFLDQARSRLVQRGPIKGGPAALPPPPKTGRPSTSASAAPEGGVSRASSRLGPRGTDAPWEPSMAEMEAEADRLQLCALLTTNEQALHAAARAKESEVTGEMAKSGKLSLEERLAAAEQRAPKAPASKPPARRPSAGKKSKTPKAEDQIISRYFCDFGYVVKGTHKVKKLKVQNITSQQVSYAIDKKLIPPGFSIDPESVQKLPGAPEFEVLDMTVTLQTGSLSVGELRHVIPIPIRQGPPIELHLVANIQTPELEVSRKELDFGRVQVGHCKAMWVQLYNPKDVPADWQVRKPMEKVRDWAFFSVTPNSGTLQPGDRVNVQMMFEPGAARNEYAQDIPIKISQNKREVRVACKGESHTLALRCEPALVDLGAILPGAEAPKEAFFRLCNDSEVALEVYSLDFDMQYLEDDEVLQHAEGYSDNNRLLLEPRSAGTGLWPNLVDANRLRKELIRAQQEAEAAAAAAAAEAEEAAAAEAAGEEDGDVAEARAASPVATPAEGDAAVDTEEVGELEMPVAEEAEASPTEATASAPDTTANILCMGPPIAGKTTMAATLAERYGAKVLVIDDVLSELMHEGAEQVRTRAPTRPTSDPHLRLRPNLTPAALQTPTQAKEEG